MLRFTVLLFLGATLFLGGAHVVSAGEPVTPGGLSGAGAITDTVAGRSGYATGDNAPSLFSTLGSIVNVALGLLGVIFMILIIYSGFKWMTAGGSEEDVKKAQQTMKNAVIGLVVVMAAWVIYYFIDTALG